MTTPSSEWFFVGLAALCIFVVLRFVDLSPQVERDFFFSREDPQLQATEEIERRFPSPPQIIIRAEGPDVGSDAYRSNIRELTTQLRKVPGVASANSIETADASRSPLWQRLLLNADGRATNLILQTDESNPAELIPRIEAVMQRFDDPAFELKASGVPYVIELIRRNLFRDLVTFSSVALILFGIAIGAIYRNWRIALGTLTACLTACAVTLGLTHVLAIGIGLLTANIVTIVFVLTLSHTVFLTANWKRISAERAADPVSEAVNVTIGASFWCMLTTLLGFLSLLVATARPLRELGIAGAIGAATAIAVAYSVYPAFLRGTQLGAAAAAQRTSAVVSRLPERNGTRWLLAFGVLGVLTALGITRLSTDPSLLSYFAEGDELRDGLEAVDRDGGSSPLTIVIRDPDGQRIDTDEVNEKMWLLQEALENDSSVGVVISPVVILAHAKGMLFLGRLGWPQLLDILEGPIANRIALSFVTPDRDEGLYYIRMRESGRVETRAEVKEQIRDHVKQSGLTLELMGGLYDLQDQLGKLIAASLRIGLGGLVMLFIGIAFIVSRTGRVTVAMVGCLSVIPLVVLGTMGHLRMSIDIISSPAANVALAMGVDSMIHMVMRARHIRERGSGMWDAWMTARAQLWQPVLGATLVICAGFGIFSLSTFPPTQRFGMAVILGTITAATMALIALPFAAAKGGQEGTRTVT